MNSKSLNRCKNAASPAGFPGFPFLLSILIVLTILTFLPVLNADFLWYDDDIMLFNNPVIKEINPKVLIDVFTFTGIVHYHPLVFLSYAVEFTLFGLNPFYFHLTNLVLHILNVLLVYFLFWYICRNKMSALIIAALFAVHPLHVESVAWVTERKDLLYSMFWLSSLIFYVKFTKDHSKVHYLLSVLFFIFSCLSKAMAVTLPLVLFLIDYLSAKKFKFDIINKLPLVIIALITAAINLNVAYYKTDIAVYDLYERISLVCYAILFYPVKMLLPYQLSAIYQYPANPGILFLVSPPLLMLLIGIIWKIKLPRQVIFGLLFYVAVIIPVLPVLPFGISITADRFSYIPLLGLFYIIAHFITQFTERVHTGKLFKQGVNVGLVLLILFLSYNANNRTRVWENTKVLMNDVISGDNRNCSAHFILGNYYQGVKYYPKAIEHYLNCIDIKSDFAIAYFNLGNVYCESRNFAEAERCFLKVIQLNPVDELAHNNLGYLYELVGDHEKALKHYEVSAGLGYEPAKLVLIHYGQNN